LSNIELRLGLWLAEQDDRVQMLANGLDLYKDFAASVFNVKYDDVQKYQRQVGKVANLSLIYGTGAAKLRDALRIMGGVNLPLEEVRPIVDLYRRMYSLVVAAWTAGEYALRVMYEDKTASILRGGICVVEGRKGIRRPSGMYMQYPNLRRVANEETGKAEWLFDSKYGPERIYGSKVFQGCTQAIARDIMAVGMLRLNKKHTVRLTVHDSAYWLAPDAQAEESLAFGIKCLTDPVSFCPGLPLAAEGSFGRTLLDC
jgi:DNA polymerase